MTMDPNSFLVQNSIFIPEDDVYIVSTHRHDFVTHTFRDGRSISVDGGNGPSGYARRVGDLYDLDEEGKYVEWLVISTDPFEPTVVDRLLWGHRGVKGDQPLSYRPIKELAARPGGVNHMRNILANCLDISPLHKRVVEYWLARHGAAQEVIEG